MHVVIVSKKFNSHILYKFAIINFNSALGTIGIQNTTTGIAIRTKNACSVVEKGDVYNYFYITAKFIIII